MTFILEFSVAMIVATISVALGTKYIGDLGAEQYRRMYDPEGNSTRAYVTAAKYLCWMAGGIAGALKTPSMITALGKALATIAGAQ